ncbi:MAG: pimeloyl-ACP methyl ester esterase BioH [Betaproteobacteria bacterium]|nr:pimeloyl-ACP methyl ester esterase BioH [Betaproteobacteria bacterium]
MRLHVETLGAGPELVLVHGWSMHGEVCHGLAERLATRFRVQVPDLPGHGRSRGEPLPALVELAGGLAERFPQAVHLCGWSLGALVAMRWALDRPGGLRRLALIAATPRFSAGEGWSAGSALGDLETFARALHKDYRGTLDRFIALQAMGSPAPRQVVADFRRRLAHAAAPDPEALDAGLHMLATADLRAEVGRIGLPTLLLHGERDAVVPEAAGAWLARALPHAHLTVIPAAGHGPFVSHEAACAAALLEHFHE